ncbi:MAG: alkaline phosphatase family protein [Magnetococcales bacterium]|nr:alkaline phosphatase family protein [Magnetococcales bacterium]
MPALLRKLISRYYNERFEDFAVRLLYFFNTIDSYVLVAGGLSWCFWDWGRWQGYSGALMVAGAMWLAFKLADFYPLFLLGALPAVGALFLGTGLETGTALELLAWNLLGFVGIQVGFMGIPDSIVARDPSVALRKIWNSLWTVAPTTVSFSMSVAFAWLLSLGMAAQPLSPTPLVLGFWGLLFAAAYYTRLRLPRPHSSEKFQPQPPGPLVERVVMLNIDGCRLDRLKSLDHPFIAELRQRGSHIPQGMETVYRALTNPAFASILTGAPPPVHGIMSNNLGMTIRVPALPDLVPTILYGSMHVKHFSKPHWETRIVSLPRHGMRQSDDIMLGWLKDDLRNRREIRLFIADLSETDFLGHAYGSDSQRYAEAMARSVDQVRDFMAWLAAQDGLQSTAILICSDHGMVAIDHSYLLFDAERYTPFFLVGPGIRGNNPMPRPASIMDITPTIAYLLGIGYPSQAGGRVLVDALEKPPAQA